MAMDWITIPAAAKQIIRRKVLLTSVSCDGNKNNHSDYILAYFHSKINNILLIYILIIFFTFVNIIFYYFITFLINLILSLYGGNTSFKSIFVLFFTIDFV